MMRETSAGEVFDDIIRRVDRNFRMMSGEHIVVEERFPEGVEILGMKREVAIRSTTDIFRKVCEFLGISVICVEFLLPPN